MNGIDTKLQLIASIRDVTSYYRQVTDVEHLTRCPFCGDSTNPNKGHMYMRIVLDESSPIQYHCARCGEGGYLTPNVLRRFGIESFDLKQLLDQLNRHTGRKDRRMVMEKAYATFEYSLPDTVKYPMKLKYVEDRLGIEVTNDVINDCKIITSIADFLKTNEIDTLTADRSIVTMYERDYIGFLSYGNSYLLLRDVSGTHKDYSWIKYPITNASRGSKIFYSLAAAIDVETTDSLTVNIAEGVFDIISIGYNLKQNKMNTLNIANTGKEYSSLISFLVSKGIVGSNVTLNIYSDNDKVFNKKENSKRRVKTELEDYKGDLYPYKFLMKGVYIKYNQLFKDYGTTLNNIFIETTRL
nr:MAG TPA: DNA primase [Caudoviricetes sp.]